MIFFRDLWKLKAEFICHRNDCVLAVFCMGISTQAKSGLVSNFYASLVTSGEWTVHRFIIFIWSQMIRKLLEIDTLLRCSTINTIQTIVLQTIPLNVSSNQSQLSSIIITSYKLQTKNPNCICAFIIIIHRNPLFTVVMNCSVLGTLPTFQFDSSAKGINITHS